jgi:hypothetical protein
VCCSGLPTTSRSEDPKTEVLSICSTLLVVVKPRSARGSPVILAHFSVKEYLTTARLAKTKDTISRFHYTSSIVAQACLGVQLHLDESITKDSLNDFPLAEYAAKHWVDHAQFENVSSKVQDGMKRLFEPSKSRLSVLAWIYDPEEPWRRSERSERPAEARATPLHYATVCNMHDIATFLIVEHSQDVNARGFDEKKTALHVSSRRGHVDCGIYSGSSRTGSDSIHESDSKRVLRSHSVIVGARSGGSQGVLMTTDVLGDFVWAANYCLSRGYILVCM